MTSYINDDDDDEEEEFGPIRKGQPGSSHRKLPNTLPVWGNASTMNINPLILQNIQGSPYFKVELLTKKTYHEVIDEIYYRVNHLEPWEKGSRKTAGQTGMCGGVRGVGTGGIVSSAYCLLFKLFTLKLTRKQVTGLLNHTDSPYIRGLGMMYIRYCQPPENYWTWFKDYLEDPEEIDLRAGGGDTVTIGQLALNLMRKQEWYATRLPRIPVIQQKVIDELIDEYKEKGRHPSPGRFAGGASGGDSGQLEWKESPQSFISRTGSSTSLTSLGRTAENAPPSSSSPSSSSRDKSQDLKKSTSLSKTEKNASVNGSTPTDDVTTSMSSSSPLDPNMSRDRSQDWKNAAKVTSSAGDEKLGESSVITDPYKSVDRSQDWKLASKKSVVADATSSIVDSEKKEDRLDPTVSRDRSQDWKKVATDGSKKEKDEKRKKHKKEITAERSNRDDRHHGRSRSRDRNKDSSTKYSSRRSPPHQKEDRYRKRSDRSRSRDRQRDRSSRNERDYHSSRDNYRYRRDDRYYQSSSSRSRYDDTRGRHRERSREKSPRR